MRFTVTPENSLEVDEKIVWKTTTHNLRKTEK